MKWLMNVNGDIWTQDESQPLKMIETKTSERPETIDFWNSRSVNINFLPEKTINDIRKEMLESELENQQTSNTKTKGEGE
jgi:hypothetical protein